MIKKVLRPLLARSVVVARTVRRRAQKYVGQRPHRSFRKTDKPRQKLGGQPLPHPLRHIVETLRFIWRERRLMVGLGLLYALASYLFVGGVSQVDFLSLKEATVQVFAGEVGSLGTAAALFTAAVSGNISNPPGELQQFLGGAIAFVFWLAVVWATRMRLADQVIKIRDALYNCCAPLVSSLLVMVVLTLQALPAALGIFGFSIAQANHILQNGIEVMMFSVAAGLLCLLSLYWLASSALALVIVSLPQTYPWRALSAASRLVIGQRALLLGHMIALVVVVFVVWAIVFIPSLLLDNWLRFSWLPLVPVIAQLLGAFSLVFGSVYIFRLYRSLL